MIFIEKQHKELLNSSLLFLFTLTKKGAIVDYNTICNSLSSTPIKKDNTALADLLIDDDIIPFNEVMKLLTETKKPVERTLRFPSNEGLIHLKFSFLFHEDYIYATGINITKESDNLFKKGAIKNFKTGAWNYDLKKQKLTWSPECYAIFDLPKTTTITLDQSISYYPVKVQNTIKEHLTDLVNNKTCYTFTEQITTKKGNIKWVRVLAEPISHKGIVISINGSITDISERKTYIEKLKYNEETKRLALKGIRSGVFDLIIDKEAVFYGDDFKKMLGLSLEQDFIPLKTYREMIHPDDYDGYIKRYHKNIEQDGYYYDNAYRLKHASGEYRHYEIHGYRKKDKNGKTVRMIGNLIDVHQKKLNKKIIRENQNRLKAIVNNGFIYTVLLNPEGEILLADDNSLEIIKKGFNINPIKEKCRFIDITPLNFKNTFAYEFNNALKGKNIKKEIERITYKGSIQWLEIKYTPIYENKKTINSVLISFLDITERKLAELATKEAHIKEQELSSLKSNILSNFSHEIRTPLNGIMTISKLLLEETDPEEQEKLLEYMETSKKRLLKTLNNLSDFSEAAAIKKNLTYTNVDVNYAVESSFREYRHMARAKKLGYDIKISEESPVSFIDESLFRSALNNIIHNAIKYTSEGRIDISIYTKSLKDFIYIAIKDTGIGINKKNQKKIFDPFVQESIGFSRKYEGTGIGLSLSKRYIEILGGKIKVKSQLGEGTEFVILIPIKK
ncbi:PAS domain-containing protein [Aquimarina sp. TRL1]|uniref:PAS domain-containing sensor histidine kinase n=1 Tax=Aquimarina sp. (strain TRL1) TaxID=2736252 RepID=UPI00158C5E08|nr:PAS domain-containing sensor histidine kinase [Aquimarina sp. TRL1]QKX07182.1 PAS domain-containing protein [Aquimarina sp. TRL1]